MTANQGGNILKKTIGLWSGILLVSTVLVGCVSATELPDKKEKIVIDYMANMVLEHDANIDYEIESIPVITLPDHKPIVFLIYYLPDLLSLLITFYHFRHYSATNI